MPPLARSILAILAGFLVIGGLSIGTDQIVLRLAPESFVGGRPAPGATGVLLLMQGYVAVYAIFGCWLTAVLAGRQPMLHALILGALGLAMNTAAVVSLWGQMPVWYAILGLALTMPYAWIGGRLREIQLAAGGAVARS